MTTKVQPVNEALDPIKREDQQLNQPQTPLIIAGLIVTAILMVYLLFTQVAMQSILLILGLLLGYTLFHARFGFTSAFRRLAAVGNGQAVRAHMVSLRSRSHYLHRFSHSVCLSLVQEYLAMFLLSVLA